MEPITDNMQKYANYKEQMGRLNKALAHQFYLEAIFIEYALLEDRFESALRHAGVFNPKKHRTIESKIKKLEDMCREKKGLPQRYFSEELLDKVRTWKDDRNRLIHALVKQSLHTEDLSKIALEGQTLLKEVNRKVSCYKNALSRRNV